MSLIDPTWISAHEQEQQSRWVCECGHRRTIHFPKEDLWPEFVQCRAFVEGIAFHSYCNCFEFRPLGLAPRRIA